ncbi:hypothetical protein acsn021_23850 [Anaerocolumna cellulosilytica]|uniref:Uncharacterized protein n=1 Tax=Anaerocolumna cellulosilytica TaxID=433286 RepID=A0A6S6QYI4_9FIRM|nr:hypothetical protein [Anaerocolumna cellulosilytica]BCJ94816.1 hypothetical protein acsn021_23850 [Anaerocolumna cellulosilytica]
MNIGIICDYIFINIITDGLFVIVIEYISKIITLDWILQSVRVRQTRQFSNNSGNYKSID